MTCTSCSKITYDPSIVKIPITEISISVDGLVTITCAGHGITNGDTVLITESNCDPNIDGFWTIILIDENTFQIRTSQVTTAGDSGFIQTDPLVQRVCFIPTTTIPGGYTYCGCFCENCCPGQVIYETAAESFFNCIINGEDIFDVTCRTNLDLSGTWAGAEIKNVSTCTEDTGNIVPSLVFNSAAVFAGCDELAAEYETWYNDTAIPEILGGGYTECETGFLIGLLPDPSLVLKYFCCNQVKTTISFYSGGTACCLDGILFGEYFIRQNSLYATGDLNITITAEFTINRMPCLSPQAPQTTGYSPACPIKFCVEKYVLVAFNEFQGIVRELNCNTDLTLACSNEDFSNTVALQLPAENCDFINLSAWGVNCGTYDPPLPNCGVVTGGAAGECISGYLPSKIISQSVGIVPICAPEPTPAYWSGTTKEINILSTNSEKTKGLIQFDNHITKSIKTIYLSKQNYLKEKRSFKFEDWNGLGQTKKTHLKIKYGKNRIICIFKITDEIKEFDDFYEIPVKFVYGKLPPDGILINLEFILPPKTTSHLTNINKLEILKRIKRRQT